MKDTDLQNPDLKLAESIQKACIQEAKNGFRAAAIQGLCMEGAMEAAVSAIQMLDLKHVIEMVKKTDP